MEIKKEDFDDIRPFNEDEAMAAIVKLLSDPQFKKVVEVNLHHISWEELKAQLLALKNRYDFQYSIIKPTIFAILDRNAKSVDCTGFENVSKSGTYTYISNHRDIVLDAAILCILLLEAGYDTCEICLGDNLLAKPWITDLLRLNKGILVKRGVGARQLYEVSKQLSEYIRFTLNEKKQSVWIAQREGRTKNSDDKTQHSVLKMLSLGGKKDFLENISEMNITPVSLSYEFDPCDYLKAKEFQLKRDNPDYKKTPADDLKNMETGILGYKGNIHFQIGRPLNQFFSQIDQSVEKNEQIAQVAALIDKEIYLNYRFYPINYVAYNKLWGKGNFFKSKYTEDDLKKVENYFQQQLDKIDIPNKDIPFLTEKLLEMYAYPLKNHLDALNGIMLYPLTFFPVLKPVLWGGEKICSFKGIKPIQNGIGESWEISHVNNNVSIVANGHLKGRFLDDLTEIYGSELVGKKVYERFGKSFPLLIKFIDAKEALSIQVHPDDTLSKERHNSFGKTEMWYVLDAAPGAFLYSGFAKQLNPEEYVKSVENNSFTGMLAKHDVHPGDVFFLPAGRVHAIGAGCFIVEIQQTSDITYRIYDFNRKDAQGNPRELHTELAKDAIDYKIYSDYKLKYTPTPNTILPLIDCPYFTTALINANENRTIDLMGRDSFSIYICMQGELSITDDANNNIVMHQGQTILIPATTKYITLKPLKEYKLLETYIL